MKNTPDYMGVEGHPRIVADPRIMAGKPVIRGTRIPVYMILGWLAGVRGVDDILADHEGLSRDDVEAALRFASAFLEDDRLAAA